MEYSQMLLDSIDEEKNGMDYKYSQSDRKILNDLLFDINKQIGTEFHYLAELDMFDISGIGHIVAKYITKFNNQSIRAYLLHYMVTDRIKYCDQILLQLYYQFKESDEYISELGNPAPAHIYVRYDNAFAKLKPKQIKNDLVKIAYNPRDAFYLPITMRMLASWKMPEIKNLLIRYLDNNQIIEESVGMDSHRVYCPNLEFIRRELKFTSLDGLKYYPSNEVKKIVVKYSNDSDLDIRNVAQKTLKVLEKDNR